MRLTTKTRYGVRALFDLAFHARGQAAQAKEIAERQGIPLAFLEQILQDVRRAGLVEGKRGPRGGYALARPPEAVRLSDAVRALQGPIEDLLGFDDANGTRPQRTRGGRRARTAGAVRQTHGPDVPALVWSEIAAQVTEAFDRVTLRDLVTRAEALGVKRAVVHPHMYFI